MARPFVQVSHDLMAAVLVAGFRDHELKILAEVIIQQFGLAKRKEVTLHPVELQQSFNVDHRDMRKALKNLVAMKVLVPTGDATGMYRLNPDYTSWELPAGRLANRLGGGLMRFIRSCLDRFPNKHNLGDKYPPNDPLPGDGYPLNNSVPVGGKGGSCDAGAPASEDLRINTAAVSSTAASILPIQSMPPGFEGLCKTAGQHVGRDFGVAMRDAWQDHRGLRAWWERCPDPDVWDRAIRDYAGRHRKPPTIDGLLAFVEQSETKARARDGRADCKAKPTPIPPLVQPSERSTRALAALSRNGTRS